MVVHISYCIAQEYQWKLMDLLPQKTLIEDNCWYDQRGEFAIMPQIILMCTLNHYYYPPYISTYYYLACTCLDFRNDNGISVQETQQMSKFCTFTHIVQNRQHLPNVEAASGRQHIRASVLNVCGLFT